MMGIILRLVPAFALALVFDWLSKEWAEQTLFLHEPVPLMGQWVQLTLGYNSGVAFGMFANSGGWLALFSSLVMAGALLWLVWAVRTGDVHPAFAWPGGLLLGGGFANLLDRLEDGRVTDFIDIGLRASRWPTFNIADACIFVAVVAFLLVNSRKTITKG